MQRVEIPCFFHNKKICTPNCQLYPANLKSLENLSQRFSKPNRHLSAEIIAGLLLDPQNTIGRILPFSPEKDREVFISRIEQLAATILNLRIEESQDLAQTCQTD